MSSYARRISYESTDLNDESLEQVRRLGEANDLLLSLHRIAQTLPASLDAERVLDSVVSSIAAVLPCDSLTILLYDDTTALWVPARKGGNRDQAPMSHRQLPEPLRAAAGARATLLGSTWRALASLASWPTPAPVSTARFGPAIGWSALRPSSSPRRAPGAPINWAARSLLEAAGLALDNAKWFARLRTLSAEEERVRLARDLHDRLGQSLAFVSFELDRVGRSARRGEDVTGSLDQLRDNVREVVGEVRETLYDLRTDVARDEACPTCCEVLSRGNTEVRSPWPFKLTRAPGWPRTRSERCCASPRRRSRTWSVTPKPPHCRWIGVAMAIAPN